MPDQVISITIPSDKVAKCLEGFLEMYPNREQIADPTWVDPGDGSEAPIINKYTDKQWVKEMMRRILVREIRRGLHQKAQNEIAIEVDDSIAQ